MLNKVLISTTGALLLLSSCSNPLFDDIWKDWKDGKGDKDVVIDSSLVLHYKLDGDATDYSLNKNDGLVSNAVPTTDRFGNPEGAMLFNGDAKIVSNKIHIVPQGDNPKTICGWMCTTDTTDNGFFTGDKMLFGFGAPAGKENFQIGVALEKWRVNGWGDSNDWRIGINGKTNFDGEWHFLAVTYDPPVTKVFFDGKEVSNTDRYTYLTPEAQKVAIGVEIDEAGWNLKGAVDDFRIYNRALTELDIQKIYTEK